MSLFAALLLLAQAPPGEPPAGPLPPAEWNNLPDLPLIRRPAPNAGLMQFVRDEVLAGRCAAAQHEADGFAVHVELAVLVDHGGEVRRIIPRAIGCPTVEQYSVGVISRMTRANVPPPDADIWYRAALDFTWKD